MCPKYMYFVPFNEHARLERSRRKALSAHHLSIEAVVLLQTYAKELRGAERHSAYICMADATLVIGRQMHSGPFLHQHVSLRC